MFNRRKSADETPAAQRIAQINYETRVRDAATFALATGRGPDGRGVQKIVEEGRAAGIPAERLAKDADAIRAWVRSPR